MEQLKLLLDEPQTRGAIKSAKGEVRKFLRKGVVDLYSLLKEEPAFLTGAKLADRVIGRGAAFLLVKGGVSEVFAYVLSQPALEVLQDARIAVCYVTLQPNIINRDGTDICPVEKLTQGINSAEEAFNKIGQFIVDKGLYDRKD